MLHTGSVSIEIRITRVFVRWEIPTRHFAIRGEEVMEHPLPFLRTGRQIFERYLDH